MIAISLSLSLSHFTFPFPFLHLESFLLMNAFVKVMLKVNGCNNKMPSPMTIGQHKGEREAKDVIASDVEVMLLVT